MLFDIKNQLGCEKFNREAREDPLIGESPFIMVRQGNCSFFDKVSNIENSGGHLAIIISETDEPVEGIFLSEEGLGNDITIPAVLISKKDGKILTDYYIEHADSHEAIKDIRLEVQFRYESLDNIVKYDVWYSPDQENAYIFFKDFRELQDVLGNSAELNVHYFTYPHFSYMPTQKQNIQNCYGSGLYCIRPGKAGVTDGTNVIKESLRQKCIYNYAYKDKIKEKRKLFWDYMEKFYDKCVYERKIVSSCADNIIRKIGIPGNEIKKCIENSFTGDKNEKDYEYYSKNSILDKEYELRKKNFVTKSPSITINDRVYLGSWRAEYVFESLCASIIRKPEACFMEVNFNRNLKGVTLTNFVLIIFAVVVINVIVFLIRKKIIKKGIEERVDSTDIDNKIDKAVGSYLALRDSAPGED